MENLITHYPSGTSLKCLYKYAQAIDMTETEKFVKFDYGNKENLQRYGTSYPPEWDMKDFGVNTVLVTGSRDELGTLADVENLRQKLDEGKTKSYYMKNYDHITFLFPRDPKPMFDMFDKELA